MDSAGSPQAGFTGFFATEDAERHRDRKGFLTTKRKERERQVDAAGGH